MTNDDIITNAKQHALTGGTRVSWMEADRKVWRRAYDRKLLDQIYAFLPPAPKGPPRAYTDDELLADAKRYPNHKAWDLAGDAERAAGTPSHHDAANKRGPEFMARCTTHMTHAPRSDRGKSKAYTEDELVASAAKFTTLSDWKHGDRRLYAAASRLRRRFNNTTLWQRCTTHMAPAINPFTTPCHVVYLCAVEATKTGYVGLSCREDKRKDAHTKRGPMFNHCRANGVTHEFRVLQRGLTRVAASQLEGFWHERYTTDGWTLLNVARTGSLGSLRRISFDELLDRAMAFDTRTDFLRGDQSAYKLAKKYGWFDEIVAHMRDQAEVRSEAQTGHAVSATAREKMRAAKVGRALTDDHKRKIGAGLRSSARYAART